MRNGASTGACDASGRAGRGRASRRRVSQPPTDAAEGAATHPERAPSELVRRERGGTAHHRHVRWAEHEAQGDAKPRALAATRAVRARRKRPSARGGAARGRALAPAPIQRLAVGKCKRHERAERTDRGGSGDGRLARDSCERDERVNRRFYSSLRGKRTHGNGSRTYARGAARDSDGSHSRLGRSRRVRRVREWRDTGGAVTQRGYSAGNKKMRKLCN